MFYILYKKWLKLLLKETTTIKFKQKLKHPVQTSCLVDQFVHLDLELLRPLDLTSQEDVAVGRNNLLHKQHTWSRFTGGWSCCFQCLFLLRHGFFIIINIIFISRCDRCYHSFMLLSRECIDQGGAVLLQGPHTHTQRLANTLSLAGFRPQCITAAEQGGNSESHRNVCFIVFKRTLCIS